MFKFQFYRLFFLLLFTLTTQNTNAICVDAEFDIYGGYRWDKISTTIQAFAPPGNFILQDTLDADNIHLWTIGIAGRELFYECLLVKGSAEWGKVCNGDYNETSFIPRGAESTTTAQVYSGNSQDFSLGGGIFLPVFCNEFSLGILGGWAHNTQRIKMRHAISDGEPEPVLNDLTYKMKWEGPWVGGEALYSHCGFDFDVGVEWHFPRWRANWKLAGPDIFDGPYSDTRWANNNNHGFVTFFNTSYPLLSCIDVGLYFKYQYWKAKHGKEKPQAGSFALVGLPANEVDKIPDASWQSYSVNLALGYEF